MAEKKHKHHWVKHQVRFGTYKGEDCSAMGCYKLGCTDVKITQKGKTFVVSGSEFTEGR